ncbi:aspartyl protease family protein At5g10770-like [Wolffia australiana]
MESYSALLLFCLLFLAASPLATAAAAACSSELLDSLRAEAVNSSAVFFPVHDVHNPCAGLASPPRLSAAQLLRRDQLRADDFNARFATAEATSAVSAPLNPGISFGVGNYVGRVGLGTPSRDYIVVFDTGSSLSWVQCRPCSGSCYKQVGPIFDPSASSSYSPIFCTSPECTELRAATLNSPSCSASKRCIYQATYGDGSFSSGFLGRETITLGGLSAQGFIHGCGEDNEGLFGTTAGLFGLAKNRLSLLYQLGPRFGYAFSYCLPSRTGSGFLSIGAYDPRSFSFTPMAGSKMDGSLYFLGLGGITVNGKALPVGGREYTSVPTIIDSGTVITRLPVAVYTALKAAVVAALAKYPRAAQYSLLDTCFKGSLKTLPVPAVSIAFAGGATLKLPSANVFYDVSSSVTCLAFAQTSNVAIIGNRQHQTFKVVYDITRARIGFAPGGCA